MSHDPSRIRLLHAVGADAAGHDSDACPASCAARLAEHEQVLGELLQLVSVLMRHTGCTPPKLRRAASLRELVG